MVPWGRIYLILWRVICATCLSLGGQVAHGAAATQDPALANICYGAIDRASRQMNIPADVMLAISLTETGRKMGGAYRPWPWTVNMEGKGFWFDTRAEALAFVKKRHAQGARSFDVGCFQINYKWHGQHFRSIEDMFDPQINATYAAKFLGDLFRELGSWSRAAGAYHSRTPEYATRYAARFDRYRARIAGRTDVQIFEGVGSEALRVAGSGAPVPQSAPEPEQKPARIPKRFEPIVTVGWDSAPVSPTQSNLGSLVNLDAPRGLRANTGRSLY